MKINSRLLKNGSIEYGIVDATEMIKYIIMHLINKLLVKSLKKVIDNSKGKMTGWTP